MKKWKAIFVSCKKYTANENSSFRKTKQNSLTLLSNCAICSKKKLAFIQNQELNNVSTDQFKMNKIINKRLLTGDKCMSQWLLKQPEFTYSVCGPFPKHRERIQKFNETGNLKHLYRNKLDKACFTHDADSKDLVKSTISDKILKNRAYEIARNR